MKNYIFLLITTLSLTSCLIKNDLILDDSKDTIVIGFSQIGAESSWRECETESIKKSASDNNIKLMFDDASQKQENQEKAIRSFIANQVDTIILSPMVENDWENVLNEAKLANIPVILLDRSINTTDQSLYKTYIGADFVKEGDMAASYLIRKYYKSDKEINIIELKGVKNSSPSIGRSKGFVEGIKEKDNFKIIYSDYGDFMPSKGKEIIREVINKNIKMDVLLSHNDSMTKGALKALDEAGIEPGKDVVIITFDGEQEMFTELQNGRINCIVECTPYLGETVIETVLKIKNNEDIPKQIFSNETYFTEWSNLENLPLRGY